MWSQKPWADRMIPNAAWTEYPYYGRIFIIRIIPAQQNLNSPGRSKE